MKRLLLGALVLLGAGCKSNPYCLNCKDSGNGVIAPADMTPGPDLANAGGGVDLAPPDLAGSGGPCTPTNGGVEICDGNDNDCNGQIDDVPPGQLDPNNCGACGNACKFANALGDCVDVGGVPTCKLGTCAPGYIDRDGDPTNGCEYVCTETNGGVEACDGKDNNCDGQVDEPFTTTWSDAGHQMPLYDKVTSNCGQCGNVCSLGPGTVMACTGTGAGGRGQCVVTGCFNGNDGKGEHQTYRHDPSKGDINITGCEYHCPKPANETGVDCNGAGACTFPGETCNGVDDDCDFTADDNLTEPGLGGPCPDGMPGKLCTSGGANPTCGNGACTAGIYKCVGGGLRCDGSVGPTPETCNDKDDDCNGKIDDPFTATWDGAGQPRYDSDVHNCGVCAHDCDGELANATTTCRLAGGDTRGSCAVLACDPGWAYVTHTDSDKTKPTCDVTTTKPKDSTQSTTGAGCFYQCPSANNSPEICDAVDNDCDGCINNGLTAPAICADKGVCAGAGVTATCRLDKGWKCDYSKIPGISLTSDDADGELTTTEKQCDALDNNCNGPCDENFPDVALPPGGTCTNAGRTAKTCTAGLGACQSAPSPFVCASSGGPTPPPYNDTEACSAAPDTAAATDELCNGKDDDCDGLVDEASSSTIGGKTFQGWHDPVVKIHVAANGTVPDHDVYVYQYEASRPDADAKSSGSLSTRACSNAGVLPWSNVTLAQAQAACAAIKNAAGTSIGRLCTAWEWQQACNGNVGSGSHWSMSASTTTYQGGVCNDASETEQRCADASQCASGQSCTSGHCTCGSDNDCRAGFACVSNVCTGSGVWPTGSDGTSSNTAPVNYCHVTYGTDSVYDMSGNLFEWTGTSVTLKSGSGAKFTVGPQAGQVTVSGLGGLIYPTDAGAQLVVTGSSVAGNNGTFDILSVVDDSTVVIANANGGNDGTGRAWKFIYNKVRGGSFTSQSGGAICEFDFDIQKASFFNTDLGFRCCSDSAP